MNWRLSHTISCWQGETSNDCLQNNTKTGPSGGRIPGSFFHTQSGPEAGECTAGNSVRASPLESTVVQL